MGNYSGSSRICDLKRALTNTRDIILFCKRNRCWVKDIHRASTEEEKMSRRLYSWTVRSGFYDGKTSFLYSDIYFKERSIYDILYECYLATQKEMEKSQNNGHKSI